MKKLDERLVAVDLLIYTIEVNKFVNISLKNEMKDYVELSGREKNNILKFVYGTIDNLILIDYIIGQFVSVDSIKGNHFALNLLRLCTYQIFIIDSDIDDVISNARKISKIRYGRKMSKYIGNIVKKIIDGIETIKLPDENDKINFLSICYSYPIWIIKYWSQYGFDNIQKICIDNTKKIKKSGVLNTNLVGRNLILKGLNDEGFLYEKDEKNKELVHFSKNYNFRNYKTYNDGLFFEIDKNYVRAIDILNPKENSNILNMCCLDGKLSFYSSIKMNGTGYVVSIDKAFENINKVKNIKKLLGMKNISEKIEDCINFNHVYRKKFDYIILEPPSSRLGEIKKMPTIKFANEFIDLKNYIDIQRKMMLNANHYLKDNGKFLYLTTTISEKENLNNINWFIDNFDFEIKEIHQTLPGIDSNTLGVFIALLERKKDNG